MAVIEIRAIANRGGNASQGYDRKYKQTYLVRTDDPQDGPLIVRAALPQIGSVYATDNETDVGAGVINVNVDQEAGDPTLWRCEVEWANTSKSNPQDPPPENPLEREPQYSVRFERAELLLQGPWSDSDAGGVDTSTGLVNSAKQPFNPPPSREETRPVIVVLVDDQYLDLTGISNVQDCVNSTDFAGFEAKTLKLNVTGIQERFEQGMRLWRKTYELSHKPQTWDLFMLDHGTIQDKDGNFKSCLLLNGSETTGPPQYKQFSVYRQIDFATHADVPQAVKSLSNPPD